MRFSQWFSQVKADPETEACPKRPALGHSGWPIVLLAAPAGVATWSGWVGLGKLTGFGKVAPLPGIADGWEIDTSILLPIGVEAYGAYALGKWLTSTDLSESTKKFAKWSALGALTLGMFGQVAYHLLTVQGVTPQNTPWWLVAAVACLPVLVLGLGSALHHAIARDKARAESGGEDDGADAEERREEAVGLGAAGGDRGADREAAAAGRGDGERSGEPVGVGGGVGDDVRRAPGESLISEGAEADERPVRRPVEVNRFAGMSKAEVVTTLLGELGVDGDRWRAAAAAGEQSELAAGIKRLVPQVVARAADAGFGLDRSYGYDVVRRELRRLRAQLEELEADQDDEVDREGADERPVERAGGEQVPEPVEDDDQDQDDDARVAEAEAVESPVPGKQLVPVGGER